MPSKLSPLLLTVLVTFCILSFFLLYRATNSNGSDAMTELHHSKEGNLTPTPTSFELGDLVHDPTADISLAFESSGSWKSVSYQTRGTIPEVVTFVTSKLGDTWELIEDQKMNEKYRLLSYRRHSWQGGSGFEEFVSLTLIERSVEGEDRVSVRVSEVRIPDPQQVEMYPGAFSIVSQLHHLQDSNSGHEEAVLVSSYIVKAIPQDVSTFYISHLQSSGWDLLAQNSTYESTNLTFGMSMNGPLESLFWANLVINIEPQGSHEVRVTVEAKGYSLADK